MEKVIENWQNFTVVHSPLDLSIIPFLEHETISEILIKASKFPAPRAFLINKQCVPYVYRQLHQRQCSDRY